MFVQFVLPMPKKRLKCEIKLNSAFYSRYFLGASKCKLKFNTYRSTCRRNKTSPNSDQSEIS